MAEYRGLNFVGIVEFLQDIPVEFLEVDSNYIYCSFNILSLDTRMSRIESSCIERLGEKIARLYGANFRQKITYEPPQGIDKSGAEQYASPRRYHQLSVLERDMFEKSVLKALKGKR